MALLNQKKIKDKLLDQSAKAINKPVVMIVDDEEQNLEVLQRCLWDKYNVIKFTSGQAALDAMKEMSADNHPRVVITDYRMPEMNGVRFLHELLQINQDAVRIMLSGRADLEAVIDAVNIGRIYQYISKPFDREHMRLVVTRAFERYELEKSNQALIDQLENSNALLTEKNDELQKMVGILKSAAKRIMASD